MTRDKRWKLSADQIRPLAPGRGACLATDMITVDGHPVRFMYREPPDHATDSGWRFMSGLESDAYMDDPANHGAHDVDMIANCDPTIVPFLDAPVGSVFERASLAGGFVPVDDWVAPED